MDARWDENTAIKWRTIRKRERKKKKKKEKKKVNKNAYID